MPQFITSCDGVVVAQTIGAIFAFLAAGFWFAAAATSVTNFMTTPIGDLDRKFTASTTLNAIGALCAGIAALCQALLINAPACFSHVKTSLVMLQ